MKQLFSLVGAGIVGGLITFGGIFLFQPGQIAHQPAQIDTPAKFVNYSPEKAPALPFDFALAAERATPSVVHITSISNPSKASSGKESPRDRDPFRFFFGDEWPSSPYDQPRSGAGSGVIYSSDGYIVTNNHVVEGATEIEVTLYDNRQFMARIIGTDKKTDLAVIKIDGGNFPTLEMGDSDAAKIGEWVLAVGNPFDYLTSTVTAGIISAKGRNIQLLGGQDAIEAFIQTDAAVNPGNSGGALLDASGKLLGINTAIATQTGVFQGYSFAIPVSLVTRIVDDIIEYGAYQRPYLGVHISDLDNEDAQSLNLNISQGVLIEDVLDGGSAQYAGIQAKDVIVKADRRDIKTVGDLQESVCRARVGETINLTINRKGKEIELPVRLKASENQ